MSKRVVVELDGDYHDQVGEEDLKRQKCLEDMGWKVIRFSNDDVLEDVEAVVRAITSHLGLEYSLVRRKPDGSGIMNSKSPTRSHHIRYAMKLSGHTSSQYIWRYTEPSGSEFGAAMEDLHD